MSVGLCKHCAKVSSSRRVGGCDLPLAKWGNLGRQRVSNPGVAEYPVVSGKSVTWSHEVTRSTQVPQSS
jgi:hypothetical protein